MTGSDELNAVLHGLQALREGDHSVRLPEHWAGTAGNVAMVFNEIAERTSLGGDLGGSGRVLGGNGADHLGGHTIELLNALLAVKKGDASVRLPFDWTGTHGKIADAFNDVVELNARKQQELARLSRVVGKEGKLKQRASLGDVTGFWRDSVESINSLIEDLVHPTSEVARVIGAVAQGDLSKSMALEVEGRPLEGEFLRTARTINTMVDQLR